MTACRKSIWQAVRPWPFKPPELFVLSVLLVVGSVFVLAIPVGAGWDEETHVIRAWEIASLSFVPNERPRSELPFPAIYWNLSYRRPVLIRPIDDRTFWTEYLDASIGDQGYIYGDLKTRSVYSPALLLPHALAMRYLGMARQMPAIPVYLASRFLGLITYAGLAWLAVRLIPFGKWVLAVAAVAPTAVFQAATISTDPISNGLGLLFLGGCLAITARRPVGRRELGAILLLVLALFMAKANLAVLALIPCLILRPSSFKMKRGYAAFVLAVLALGLLIVGGWAAVGYPRLDNSAEDVDAARQLLGLLQRPYFPVKLVLVDFLANAASYLTQVVAEFGYDYWSVPIPTYVLYFGGLLAAVFADGANYIPDSRTRVVLILVFLAGYLATVLSLYIADTAVGSAEIQGVQGRYFAALIPLPLLVIVGKRPAAKGPIYVRWAIGLCTASVLFFGLGLLLSYHIECGTAFYEPGPCLQPVYKNWAPNASYSPPISKTTTLSQEIAPECDGATELRVWVDSSGASADAQVEFSLAEPAANRVLARATVANRELAQGGWYSLGFDPEWRSSQQVYVLTAKSSLGVEQIGPRLAYTLRPEYEAGKLYEDGVPSEVDLVFKYGCVAGWRRLLLEVSDERL